MTLENIIEIISDEIDQMGCWGQFMESYEGELERNMRAIAHHRMAWDQLQEELEHE